LFFKISINKKNQNKKLQKNKDKKKKYKNNIFLKNKKIFLKIKIKSNDK
jgi:hypothetical protein